MRKTFKFHSIWAAVLSTMLIVMAFAANPLPSQAATSIVNGIEGLEGAGGAKEIGGAAGISGADGIDGTDGIDSNSGLAGAVKSGNDVLLYWSNEGMPSAPTGFVVARSTTLSEQDFHGISPILSPSTTAYWDNDLAPGTYYYCIVIIRSDMSYGPWTGVMTVTID